ncbi:MAG: ABC transporter ATP-binding protein [Bacillota bacterium]|jgi:branched-chain amino acid transport system ATP-binding protein
MLQVRNLQVDYDGVTALHDVSFEVRQGEIVTIVGSNGAGKTTILKTILGICRPRSGEVRFEEEALATLPTHQIVRRGIAYVPEGRRLFGRLTVRDNLMMGAISRPFTAGSEQDLQGVYEIFPILAERQTQKAGTLSGGEQQMLAIARGLMFKPKLLMLDEPSLGLMPKYVTTVFRVVGEVNRRGVTVVLVEQKVREALRLASRGYVLQTGRTVMEGTGEELLGSDLVKRAYLGM